MKNEIIEELEDKLKKSLASLQKDMSKLRTGVASVTLLDDIKVNYYNQPTPLNQVATVGVADSRTITIQPWDNSAIGEIEKAIQKSDIGVTPQSDGKTIRLTFPPSRHAHELQHGQGRHEPHEDEEPPGRQEVEDKEHNRREADPGHYPFR